MLRHLLSLLLFSLVLTGCDASDEEPSFQAEISGDVEAVLHGSTHYIADSESFSITLYDEASIDFLSFKGRGPALSRAAYALTWTRRAEELEEGEIRASFVIYDEPFGSESYIATGGELNVFSAGDDRVRGRLTFRGVKVLENGEEGHVSVSGTFKADREVHDPRPRR